MNSTYEPLPGSIPKNFTLTNVQPNSLSRSKQTPSLENRIQKHMTLGQSARRTLIISMIVVGIFLLMVGGFLVWWFLFRNDDASTSKTPSISVSFSPLIPVNQVTHYQLQDLSDASKCYAVVNPGVNYAPFFTRTSCGVQGEWADIIQNEMLNFSELDGATYCVARPAQEVNAKVFGDFTGCVGAKLNITTKNNASIYFHAAGQTFCVSEVPSGFIWNNDLTKCLQMKAIQQDQSMYDAEGDLLQNNTWFEAEFGHLLTR